MKAKITRASSPSGREIISEFKTIQELLRFTKIEDKLLIIGLPDNNNKDYDFTILIYDTCIE